MSATPRILGLCCLLVASLNLIAQADFSERSAPDIELFPFFHGVASGDPTADAVIIWTRLTTDDLGPYPVNWRVATDAALSNEVAAGTFFTDATRDFTVKVDVTGLSDNTWYYYEFEYKGRRSLIGRTRTAPAGVVDSLRFGVVSCSNYQAGFFNAYGRIGERNDLDAVLHLGDYIYEYETGGYGFVGGIGRDHDPDNEIITLSDYRLRHSWYKLDNDLRFMQQHYPVIAIYDDHEFADNAWTGGAGNHNSGEGSWSDRRSAAFTAWLEWMPVRDPLPSDSTRVYRNIEYGDLVELMMVDTRVEGRDEQSLFSIDDPSRTLLGADQFDWLTNRLKSSTAQWKVMVNQVMVAPLEVFGVVVNSDQWDGYRAERERLFDTLGTYNIDNFVVLTGDIHSAWANDIPSSSGNVGVEFVATSVTSPALSIPGGEFFIRLFNSHVRYVELERRGYMLMDFNSSRAQGDHYFVGSVTSIDSTQSVGASWEVTSGTVSLINSSGPSVRPGVGPERPPLLPVNSCGTPENPNTTGISSTTATIQWDASPGAVGYRIEGRLAGSPGVQAAITAGTSLTFAIFNPSTSYEWRVAASCDGIQVSSYSDWVPFTTPAIREPGSISADPLQTPAPRFISVYPVPVVERVGVHFQHYGNEPVLIQLLDVQGKIVLEERFERSAGTHFVEFEAGHLAAGTYALRMGTEGHFSQRVIVKQ